ncbi:MAG: patatin-like phospholipase family protein, partial [Prevotella sp.]|nr:patatin-like phospholipase family protein [Prevotella sp.]
MNILEAIKGWFPFMRKSKDVALVLGGGGARGIAHIGGIEVLEERGYNITSVAGTSMGALVGGMYAGGKLKELKDIILGIDKKQ